MASVPLVPLGPDSELFAEKLRPPSSFKDDLRRLQALTFPPAAFWEICLKGGEEGGRNSRSIFKPRPIKAGFTSEAL